MIKERTETPSFMEHIPCDQQWGFKDYEEMTFTLKV